jgi:SAM-dependent methyltransferase
MNEQLAQTAADFYAKTADRKSKEAQACSGCAPTPALATDYDAESLAAAPADAVRSSFGCGDPLAFSEVRPGDTIVDLGCGAGLDLILAAERVGAAGRVIGVDASPDMLARARANVERAGVAALVEFHQGVIEALPIEDSSADWVISNCVVNLSPDKARVFSEIRRILKPGGRVLIADLVADDLPDWVRAHSDLYSACISGAVSEGAYLAFAAEADLVGAKVVDRLCYDASIVRGLLDTSLPIAVDAIAARMKLSRDGFLDLAARELAGRVASVKLRAERPA